MILRRFSPKLLLIVLMTVSSNCSKLEDTAYDKVKERQCSQSLTSREFHADLSTEDKEKLSHMVIHIEQKDFQQAKALLDVLISSNPHNEDVLFALVEYYILKAEYSKNTKITNLEKAFDKMLELIKDCGQRDVQKEVAYENSLIKITDNLALEYISQSNLKRAEEILDSFARLGLEGDHLYYYARGIISHAHGKWSKSIESLKKSIALYQLEKNINSGAVKELYSKYLDCNFRLKRYSYVISKVSEILLEYNDTNHYNGFLYDLRGRSLLMQGDKYSALGDFREAIKYHKEQNFFQAEAQVKEIIKQLEG